MNYSVFKVLTLSFALLFCACKSDDGGTSQNSTPPKETSPESANPFVKNLQLFDINTQKKINLENDGAMSLVDMSGDLTIFAEVSSDVDRLTYSIANSTFERTNDEGWALSGRSGSEWQRYPFQLDKEYSISVKPQAAQQGSSGKEVNLSFTLTHPDYTTKFSMHEDCEAPAEATSGNTWYVDPVSGSIAGNGSKESPWRTLQEVIEQNLFESRQGKVLPYDGTGELMGRNVGAPIQPGDTIYLMSGNHGDVYIRGAYNTDYIKITNAPGETPVINSIQLLAASKWLISGVSFLDTTTTLFYAVNHSFHGPSDHIIIENSTLKSIEDSSSWSASDWVNLASNGINISASCSSAYNNVIENTKFSIQVSGEKGTIAFNKIKNFSGDGVRAGANHILIRGNHISENFTVDANHDDGIQSFTFGDPIENLVIDGNTIIQTQDLSRPHQGGLQGIGLFDGFFDDLVVINNVVIVEAPHGIAVYGTNNGYVANNTVVGEANPWIMVRSHKNGSASTGIVENNLANQFISDTNVVVQGNMTFTDPDEHFVAFDRSTGTFDMHLKKTSAARGAAIDSDQDVLWDLEGYLRGSSADLGALIYREAAQ